MAIFYGLYVEDKRLASALDALRCLAEPEYFRRAHVTVRGPYERRLNSREEALLRARFGKAKEVLEFQGIGNFFSDIQNTVFVKCGIPGILNIWKKPNYGNFAPHLTIYDGVSRKEALIFERILMKYDWKFSAYISKLQLIEGKKYHSEGMLAILEESKEVLDSTYDGKSILMSLQKMPIAERIKVFNKICAYISSNFESAKHLGQTRSN